MTFKSRLTPQDLAQDESAQLDLMLTQYLQTSRAELLRTANPLFWNLVPPPLLLQAAVLSKQNTPNSNS